MLIPPWASWRLRASVKRLGTAKGVLKGIMGGKAGRQLLDEHRRGACGTMPACEAADVHALCGRHLRPATAIELGSRFIIDRPKPRSQMALVVMRRWPALAMSGARPVETERRWSNSSR